MKFESDWYKYSKEEQKSIIASFRKEIDNVNQRINKSHITTLVKTPLKTTSFHAINTQTMANNYFSLNHINN